MAINLLEKVQENLRYPALKKIDPNIHEQTNTSTEIGETKFSQAAIPAVLVSLYKYSTTDEGATEILRRDYSTNWVSKIFDDTKQDVIEKIAAYANSPRIESFEKMDDIADEAIKVANENLPPDATIKDVKIFFSSQVNHILPYLEPELHMGETLNDTTIDDNTNKMKGPLSSLMHSIGSAFSTPETEEDKHPKL